MKKLKILFLLLFILPVALNAQNSKKQKELGLTVNNIRLEDFGITYKFGKPSAMWRFSALTMSLNNISDLYEGVNTKRKNLNFAINVGREFRKVIKDDFEFRYGLDIGFYYSKSESETINDTDPNNNSSRGDTGYQPQAKFVLGVNYVLKNKIVFGFEVLPGISYNYSVRTLKNGTEMRRETDSHSIRFGTSGEFALFSMAYRF